MTRTSRLDKLANNHRLFALDDQQMLDFIKNVDNTLAAADFPLPSAATQISCSMLHIYAAPAKQQLEFIQGTPVNLRHAE